MQATRRWLLCGVMASFCLTVFTCYVSMSLHPRFEHRDETIDMQLRILEGKDYVVDGDSIYFPEFQNRVLFGLVLREVLKVTPLKKQLTYRVLRFATGLLALFAFWTLLTLGAGVSERTALVALGLLAYAKVYTYNHGWEHPTDFFDVFFTCGFAWAVFTKRRLALLGIVIAASFNRESSPYAGVLWFFMHGFSEKYKPQVKEMAFGALVSVTALAAVLSLRYGFGGWRAIAPQTTGIIWIASMLYAAMKNPLDGWLTLLVCLAIPYAYWIGSRWKTLPAEWQRLTIGGVAVACLSGFFSVMMELRTFLPAITVLTLVAAKAETFGQTSVLPAATKVRTLQAA